MGGEGGDQCIHRIALNLKELGLGVRWKCCVLVMQHACVCVCVSATVRCKDPHLVTMSTAMLPHVTVECLLVLEELVTLRALELGVTVTTVWWSEDGQAGCQALMHVKPLPPHKSPFPSPQNYVCSNM